MSESEIKIEKNVAFPQGRRMKYPFSKMEVGDSFYVEGGDFKRSNSIANAANQYSRNHTNGTAKFATRKENNGLRCWRMK